MANNSTLTQRKADLTQHILDEVPDCGLPFEEAIILFWFSENHSGMRLSKYGHIMLHEHLKMKAYNFALGPNTRFSPTFLLATSKKLISPYYIQNKSITLFGSKEALAVIMSGGDFESFLERNC